MYNIFGIEVRQYLTKKSILLHVYIQIQIDCITLVVLNDGFCYLLSCLSKWCVYMCYILVCKDDESVQTRHEQNFLL